MKKHASLLQIHISVFLFGFAGLFGKWIPLDAIGIVWGRVLFASIAFGIYFFVKKIAVFKLPLKSILLLAVLGVLLAFHWWSFFKAIQLSNVALGLLSFASFPVFTALLEAVFFKTPLSLKTILLVLVSSLGIYIILPEWDWQSEYAKGVFWGVMSGLSFAILTLFNQKIHNVGLLPKENASVILSFFQDFFALIVLSPFVGFSYFAWSVKSWMLLSLLGIVFTALGHFLYINGLKKERASRASLISNLEPVYGILLAFFLLKEAVSLNTIIGGSIILLAAIVSSDNFWNKQRKNGIKSRF
jgi:drug/metabolite transporter (DMT)-like permease